MAKSHLTIKHSMPEAGFRHALRMAEILPVSITKNTPETFTLDFPAPATLSECDELVSYLSFTPSLGAAVADALEGSDAEIDHLIMQVSLDKSARPQNAFPAQVGARLHKILQKISTIPGNLPPNAQ
jgi:hypothetical protein